MDMKMKSGICALEVDQTIVITARNDFRQLLANDLHAMCDWSTAAACDLEIKARRVINDARTYDHMRSRHFKTKLKICIEQLTYNHAEVEVSIEVTRTH